MQDEIYLSREKIVKNRIGLSESRIQYDQITTHLSVFQIDVLQLLEATDANGVLTLKNIII